MYCERCGRRLEDNEVCNCLPNNNLNQQYNQFIYNEENGDNRDVVENSKKNNWKVILTAIIYPVIVLILGILIPGVHLTYLLLSLVLCGGFSAFMVLGGFYLIIIPLPVVFLFTYGSCKSNLSLGKKILYGILAAICIIGAFSLLFVR